MINKEGFIVGDVPAVALKIEAQPERTQFLRDVLEHGIGNTCLADDNYNMHHLLKSRMHLLQMVEAAHLITVRSHKTEIAVNKI